MKLSKVFASKMDTMGWEVFVITLLYLGSSVCNAQFRTPPRNTATVRDVDVTFTCETDATNANILWQRSDGLENFESVALDATVFTNFQQRYAVDYESSTTDQTTRSVLSLSGVLPTDAGTLRCQSIADNVDAYSQFIVLDSDPQVEQNVTSIGDMVEGEYFALTCSIGYSSAISWAPVMIWRENGLGDLETLDQSTPNEARYTYASTTERTHNGRVFQCETAFPAIPDDNLPANHDTTPPEYTSLSNALTLTVNYQVEALQLTNPKDVYNPGERLTITAVGRPGPSFYWINRVDNSTIDGNILEITTAMEGSQNWTYFAYNEIRGERQEISGQRDFMVVIPTTTTTPRPTSTVTPEATSNDGGPDPTTPDDGGLSGGAIAGIVIGCLLALVLIILLLYCCISRNKSPKTTKEKTKQANHVDAIRNQPQMVLPPGDIAYIDKEKGPPPYNQYAPPSVKTDEGLVYADLAFEDKPRSRKPIQVYESTDYGTDYGDIL